MSRGPYTLSPPPARWFPPPARWFPAPVAGEGGVFSAVKPIVDTGMVSWPTYIYIYVYSMYKVNEI